MQNIKITILLILFFIFSCKNKNDFNKTEKNTLENTIETSTTIEDIETSKDRELQFLYFANGGLIGYFDDGTIVGCPRCDLMNENIEAIKTRKPHSKFKILNNLLISKNGDTIPINSMKDNEWAIVNYKNNLNSKKNKEALVNPQDKVGIIITKTDSLKYSAKYCCILSPEQGFTAYKEPNGKVLGKIKRIGNKKSDDQFAYAIYFVSKTSTIKLTDYSEIGYEIFALNFTDYKNGFVKLKNDLIDIWLKVDEINQLGFTTITWMDFMILNSEEVLGYYAKEPGLRIRKEPNTTSKIISSVRGDLYEIKLTKTVSGQWVKVKVIKYKEHACSTNLSEKENFEFKTEGWMKIIGDNGTPNIYNYNRGC